MIEWYIVYHWEVLEAIINGMKENQVIGELIYEESLALKGFF